MQKNETTSPVSHVGTGTFLFIFGGKPTEFILRGSRQAEEQLLQLEGAVRVSDPGPLPSLQAKYS